MRGLTDFYHVVDLPEPEEPRLNIANVNLLGVLYTVKLALFYFRKQHAAAKKEENPDHVLILGGSIAGYIDFKAGVQYTAAKHGLRGMMGVLRRTERQYNTRVNYIAPWYVRFMSCLGS